MHCHRRWCCAAAFLAGGVAAAAAPARAVELPPDTRSVFSFTLDNDLFGGSDRYYTSGFQFSWRSSSYDPPAWLGGIVEAATFFFPQGGSRRWGLAFGQGAHICIGKNLITGVRGSGRDGDGQPDLAHGIPATVAHALFRAGLRLDRSRPATKHPTSIYDEYTSLPVVFTRL